MSGSMWTGEKATMMKTGHRMSLTRSKCLVLAGICGAMALSSVIALPTARRSAETVLYAHRMPDPKGFVSPDGHYVANIRFDKDEVSSLRVKPARKGASPVSAFRSIESVNGFLWLPKAGHTLVFAAKRGPSERAFIGLWNGKSTFKVIRSGILPRGCDPDAEYYAVAGVTADGRTLLYRHYDATSRAKEAHADERAKVALRMQLLRGKNLGVAGLAMSH